MPEALLEPNPQSFPSLLGRPPIARCHICTVRRVSVCDAIPENHLPDLALSSTEIVARPGTIFVEEGQQADAFFNISRGNARIYKLLPDGRRQIVGFAGPGQFLGFADGEDFAFSAEAIDIVTYCRFSRSRLQALRSRFPAMEKIVLKIATAELIAAQQQMVLLGRKTARERLASFLAARLSPAGGARHPGESLILPMSRTDIADYLGLSAETICRTFAKLAREELIEIAGISRIVVRDRFALEILAGQTVPVTESPRRSVSVHG